MEIMFWVWLGVIVLTAVIEFATMDLTSIWFTVGGIIPFIMSAIGGIRWEIQLAVFIVVSALLIIFLRKWAKKVLLKNTNEKTNMDSFIGKKVRLISRTDFETHGSLKINDVVWSAITESEAIEADEIVEIVKVDGNKLIVKKLPVVTNAAAEQEKEEVKVAKRNSKGGK